MSGGGRRRAETAGSKAGLEHTVEIQRVAVAIAESGARRPVVELADLVEIEGGQERVVEPREERVHEATAVRRNVPLTEIQRLLVVRVAQAGDEIEVRRYRVCEFRE